MDESLCAAMQKGLGLNETLENLTLLNVRVRHGEFALWSFGVLVTALQHNTTVKTLRLHHKNLWAIRLTDEKDKQMAALLRKNYGLESLPSIDLEDHAGDVGAILRLNAAERRYLVQDGSSISKGVKVLSSVNNDINCVFLHLLENPNLCDRSAVEAPGFDESNSHSTSPNAIYSSGGGKREQDILHNGKESRRRLG